MSKNGSIRESIFSIYVKENPAILSETLGFHVGKLSLEQRHANRNIDIHGIDPQRRIGVYVEVQLTKANASYFERIKNMMESYPESSIVWIAESFDDQLLKDLITWMEKNHKRYIDFYALALNSAVHPVLKQLNEMYKLDIYEHFYLMDEIDELFSVRYMKKQLNQFHCGQMHTAPLPLDSNRPEDVKRALLEFLRKRIPYFLNLHYGKKTNQHDRILTIGAGKSGIIFRCSARSNNYIAFVELYFDKSCADWYESFKSIEHEIRSTIHPDISFGNRRIGVYFKPSPNQDKTFEEIADIFKKMIDGFSLYTFGNKQIISQQKVEAGKFDPTQKRFVQVPIPLPEQPFPTEESYRIQMEELSEQLLFKL